MPNIIPSSQFLGLLGVVIALSPASAQVRGELAAVGAAERLLEYAGGREAWSSARTFAVEERVFLNSGEVATLYIVRDLETGNRRLERISEKDHYIEWLSTGAGFEISNGKSRRLAAEELAIELQGLRQEPYAIYRRLSLRDPALRVQLRDQNRLFVYDEDERLLCWFVFDGKGAATSWGNFWNGTINQHYYGPTVKVGNVNLPKWGVSASGSFRFEYVRATLDDRSVKPPLPTDGGRND